MPDWQSLFSTDVPLLETIIRGTVMYFAVLCLMRFIGRREVGGPGITDVLLVVLVAEAASPGLQGDASSLTDAVVLVATVLGWSVAIDAIGYRSKRLARFLKARARPLIEDGELNHKVLKRELMTEAEVESQLRLHGIEDVATVKSAYIEANGMISVLRKDSKKPDIPERPKAVGWLI